MSTLLGVLDDHTHATRGNCQESRACFSKTQLEWQAFWRWNRLDPSMCSGRVTQARYPKPGPAIGHSPCHQGWEHLRPVQRCSGLQCIDFYQIVIQQVISAKHQKICNFLQFRDWRIEKFWKVWSTLARLGRASLGYYCWRIPRGYGYMLRG